MREEPLTPTHSKTHAPAKYLLQARAPIKDLLAPSDLAFLLELDEEATPDWSIGASQKNSDQDRFLAGLQIREWDVGDFVGALHEEASEKVYLGESGPNDDFMNWLSLKSDDWHQQMYSLLYKELTASHEFYRLDHVRIARLSDGSYSTGKKCYFPSEGTEHDAVMPRVMRSSYSSGSKKTQQEEAREFLEAIGVHEVGEEDEIKHILLERYSEESSRPSDKTHAADIRRFFRFCEEAPSNRVPFQQHFIFRTEDKLWAQPGTAYLDLPYTETLLCEYYDPNILEHPKSRMSRFYKDAGISVERFVAFAQRVGVISELPIVTVTCANNPLRNYLYNAPGQRFSNYGRNRDYVIVGLKKLLAKKSERASRLVWNTMCAAPVDVLQARYRNNLVSAENKADSLLVTVVRNAEWVPQKNGKFVCPAMASRSLLPRGFPVDEGYDWLKAVRFGDEEHKQSEESKKRQAAAKELGFSDEDILEDAQWFAGLSIDERRHFREETERRRSLELPEDDAKNPERRAARVEQQASTAPERLSEKRQRSVSVGIEEVKLKAEQYLRQQYTNSAGVMICQICQDELPFKNGDDTYYFEKVQFLIEMEDRHYQNYIALCPNHSAMFQYVHGSRDTMLSMFKEMDDNRLAVTLAQRNLTIYFTSKHRADLRSVMAAESGRAASH